MSRDMGAMYSVQLYDANLQPVGRIHQLSRLRLRLQKNAAGEASFSLPHTEALASELALARHVSIHRGTDLLVSGRIRERDASGPEVSISVVGHADLLRQIRTPANWQGWGNRDLADVLRDLVKPFAFHRWTTQADWQGAVAFHHVDLATEPGKVMLAREPYLGAQRFMPSGYIVLRIALQEALPTGRIVRWSEEVGSAVRITVQTRAANSAAELDVATWGPEMTAAHAEDVKEHEAIGVPVVDGGPWVDIRFNLYTDDTSTPDHEQAPTIYGFTPMLTGAEIIWRKAAIVQPGNIPASAGITLAALEFSRANALQVLSELCGEHGWQFRVYLSGSQVGLDAGPALGGDLSDAVVLRHGENAEFVVLRDSDEDLVNVLHCFGAGDGPNQLYVELRDEASIAQYGEYHDDFTDSSLDALDALASAGQEELDKRRQPKPVFEIMHPFGAVPAYGVGDAITAADPRTGRAYTVVVEEYEVTYDPDRHDVRASLNAAALSLVSHLVAARRRAARALPQPLRPPAMVRAVADHRGVIVLWSHVRDATGYDVERSDDSGATWRVAVAHTAGLAWADTSVAPDQAPLYRVCSRRGDRRSEPSATASARAEYADTADLAPGSVTSAILGDGAVTTPKISDGAVQAGKIADASITGAKIAAASIGTAHIQDLAVTNAKIAGLAAEKITTGTLHADRIKASAISAINNSTEGLTIQAPRLAFVPQLVGRSSWRAVFDAIPSDWIFVAGSAANLSLVEDPTSTGGKVLRASGLVWLVWPANIPFDPTATYRIAGRVRQVSDPTSGGKRIYIGVEGVAADGATRVNKFGANSYGSQHYIAAAADTLATTAGWVEFVGYFKGTAATGSAKSPALDSPGKLHANVRYIRPLFILNYSAGNGVADIDYLTLEIVDNAWVAASNQIWLDPSGLYMRPAEFTHPGMQLTGRMLGFWDINTTPALGLGDVRALAQQLKPGSGLEYGLLMNQGAIWASEAVIRDSLTTYGTDSDKLADASVVASKLAPGAVQIGALGSLIQVPAVWADRVTVQRWKNTTTIAHSNWSSNVWRLIQEARVPKRDATQGYLMELAKFEIRVRAYYPADLQVRLLVDGVEKWRQRGLPEQTVTLYGLLDMRPYSDGDHTFRWEWSTQATVSARSYVRALYQNEQLPLRFGRPIYTLPTGGTSGCYQSCEVTCQATCEGACQSTCESSCQDACQGACQATCELTAQGGGGCLREGTPITIWDPEAQGYREVSVERLQPGMILPRWDPVTDTITFSTLTELRDAGISARFLRIHTDIGPSIDVTWEQPFDVLVDMGDGEKVYRLQAKDLQHYRHRAVSPMKLVRPLDTPERRIAAITGIEVVREPRVHFWWPITAHFEGLIAAGYSDLPAKLP